MIDIQFIRDNPEVVAEKSKQKGYDIDIKKLLSLDEQRRELLQKVEEVRTRRNEHSASLKAGKPTLDQIEAGKKIKDELSAIEEKLPATEQEFNDLWRAVPNMPLDTVPIGASEDENVVIKSVGVKPQIEFEAKNHAAIAEAKGWLDKERAAKVASSRFAYIVGDLVKLQFAIMQFVVDILTNEKTIEQIISSNKLKLKPKPFVPVLPPAMVNTTAYEATSRLDAEEVTYKLADDEMWMNASAEHSLCNMFMNETIQNSLLPLRYIGYATSFRREAGTYGKDMEGIIRLHQFDKLEMEVFSNEATGEEEHKLLVAVQEYLMQQLSIPYQVVQKCTADIGRPNAQGVDIEAWLPGQGKYRETHTADYMTDYQARRLRTKVKYLPKDAEQQFGNTGWSGLYNTNEAKLGFVHTNDATAFALGRIMVAIIENYQTKDGDVVVPEVLRPYMGGREKI